MKKTTGVLLFSAIVMLLFAHGFADTTLIDAPITIEYAQEDRVFYEACFEHARENMPDPDRSDPEYVYRNQAKYCEELGAGGRTYYARQNMLWGLAREGDIPRDEALMIGYAALELIVQTPRAEMNRYYADAWMNISNPEKRIWQVHMSLAAEYRRQRDGDSYIVYIDAGTGEIVDVTRH